jgi:hypothetical protein
MEQFVIVLLGTIGMALAAVSILLKETSQMILDNVSLILFS